MSKRSQISILLLVMFSLIVGGLFFIYPKLNKQDKNTATSKNNVSTKHFKDPSPTVNVQSIAESMKPLPKGDTWSIEYDEASYVFTIKVDAQQSYSKYEENTKEAFTKFIDKGFNPCTDPLAQSIVIKATNLPDTPSPTPVWELCKS